MLGKSLLPTLATGVAAGALALGLSANAWAENSAAENSTAAVDVPTAIAPQAPSDSREALVFSTDAPAAQPLLPAEDVAVAEQLRNLIENDLARSVPRQADRSGVEAFYRSRGFAPIWVANGKPSPRAHEAIAYLHGVAADGLDPADYPTPYFNDLSPHAAATDELFLTNAVLAFARHASTGRVAFSRVSASIYFDLKQPDPSHVLTKLTQDSGVRAALDGFHPQHPAYKALKAALAGERGSTNEGEKPPHIPNGPLLRPGAEDDRVALLRKRLSTSGDASPVYDDDLVTAVKTFQETNALNPDGIVGAATLARLNGETHGSRADTILANMERWRWMPRDLGESYVIVNVPDYTLKVVHQGTTVWSTRIVVGKPGTQATPIFTETMKFITVNPTWNVPPSIIRNEYLPALQRDPNALARIGLRMTRNADGSLRVYQPPGERNALGRIRFNFPNKFLVFQHDTPDKHLFDREARAFSHGCMRVQSPETYAEVLLSISQPQEGYTAERIENLYGAGERTIKFDKPIPVYVTYQTAFVDGAGHLQTRRDIYGHDKATADILRGHRLVADVPVPRNYHSSSKPVMGSVPQREPTPQREDFRESFGRFDRQPFRGFGFPFGNFDRHTRNW